MLFISSQTKSKMEPENQDDKWSCTTSWTVTGGSLTSSVTFESSSTPIADDDDDDEQSTVDSIHESVPLILSPPPLEPDPVPCDITFTFARKQEVRQVYVRSTARVFEIYYAHEVSNGSEYLCTVHCGIVCRDDQVLQTNDIERTILGSAKGLSEEATEKNMKNDSNLSTNEDDWVDVKVSDTLLLSTSSKSLSSNAVKLSGNINQNYYEATAEINDANPCVSLSIRLLSLQNKGCLCLQEVYVFADLADPIDSKNQSGSLYSSSGSSLMAMLVPAFLQLSKSASGQQEKTNTFTTWEGQKPSEEVLETINPISDANKISQVERNNVFDRQKMRVPDKNSTGPTDSVTPPQGSQAECKHYELNNRLERVLEQLVSRVSMVEDLLLRFEEKMLKPINNIDVRLQHVEQQLEVLQKKTQNSGTPNWARFSAPDFPCCDSDCSSFYNDGADHVKPCKYSAKETPLNVISVTPDGDSTSPSVNTEQLQPCLVITAPEFSTGDYDEEDHPLDILIESPKVKRKAISIDDALAASLAGFSSMISSETSKYIQNLGTKAPELNEEGKHSDTKEDSPLICLETKAGSSIYRTECLKSLDPLTCNIDSFEAGENLKSFHSGMSFQRIPVVYTAALQPQKESFYIKDQIESGEIDDEVIVHSDHNIEKKDERDVRKCCRNDDDIIFHSLPVDLKATFTPMNDLYGIKDATIIVEELRSYSNDNFEENPRPFGQFEQFLHSNEDDKRVEVMHNENDFLEDKKADVLEQHLGNNTDETFTTQEDPIARPAIIDTEKVSEESSQNDILCDALNFRLPNSMLDFELPILDVRFTSEKNCDIKSSFEAFLAESMGIKVESQSNVNCVDDCQIDDKCSLISVDDGDLFRDFTTSNLMADMDYYTLSDMHMNVEGKKFEDHRACSKMSISLI